MIAPERVKAFESDIRAAINRHSMECECGNTPDFILAAAAVKFMLLFGDAAEKRDSFYQHDHSANGCVS